MITSMQHNRIKLKNGTYIRNYEDEVLLYSPRTEGVCVIRNAIQLLGKLSTIPVDIEYIIANAAKAYGIAINETEENEWRELLDNLVRLGLLEYEKPLHRIANKIEACPDAERRENISEIESATDFFKRHNIPSELHVDLSSMCTERCVHCYLPEYPNRFLDYALAGKVLREFRDAQGLTVYLTGGECMLHPRFDEICRLCKKLSLNVIILTNLTCCNEQRILAMKEIEPQFVSVSIYSMDPAIHDSITGVAGSWQKTMDAFFACEKAGIPLRIASPLLKANRESFTQLGRFAIEHNARFAPNFTIWAKSNGDTSNLEYACSENELRETLSSNKEIFGRNLFCGDQDTEESKVCRIGTLRLCINSNGDYYPCDGMHGYVLGNASCQSLDEIWNGARLARLRGLRVKDFEKCRVCKDRGFCLVCPAFNFNATGNLLKPHKSKCDVAAIVHSIYGERSMKC